MVNLPIPDVIVSIDFFAEFVLALFSYRTLGFYLSLSYALIYGCSASSGAHRFIWYCSQVNFSMLLFWFLIVCSYEMIYI